MRPQFIARLRAFPFAVLLGILAAPPLLAALDTDGDGFPEAMDCNDTDAQVWALPGEATNLRFTGKTTIVWDAPVSAGGATTSLRYDTLRSASPSNFASTPPAGCSDPEGLTAATTDADVPAPGTGFFYLVRATNGCGDGTLGNQSKGNPIVGIACDCSVLCSDSLSCTRDYCADGVCAHDAIPPAIGRQPESVAVCPGSDAHFSLGATGQGTFHFQWKKNGVDVGTDSPDLTLAGIAAGDDGSSITCLVTDGCASIATDPALLTVFASTASCSGGNSGTEAPGGASGAPYGTVSLHSGEVRFEVTDLVIPGRGFDFEWTRTYSSREGHLTAMGHDWDFSYNRFVSLDVDGTAFVVADGRAHRDRYELASNGCYTAQGFFRELCSQDDGSFVLTFPDKTTWRFLPLDGTPAAGKIQSVEDSNHNAMTFSYDAASGNLTTITDTRLRVVTVTYVQATFISSIQVAGRELSYLNAPLNDERGGPGDLVSVTTPAVTGTPTGNDYPLGKTTTYTYTKNMPDEALDHNLLTITDPLGQVVLKNTYTTAQSATDPRFDRIDRQTTADGTTSFVYVAQTPSTLSDAVTKTIVKDPQGNVSEVFFNALNQAVLERDYTGRAPNPGLPTDDVSNRPTGKLRATDPDYFETRWVWSAASLLTYVLFPEGNSTTLTYDVANPDVRLRGNLLQSVVNPGPRGGDQTAITESWTYGTTLGTERYVVYSTSWVAANNVPAGSAKWAEPPPGHAILIGNDYEAARKRGGLIDISLGVGFDEGGRKRGGVISIAPGVGFDLGGFRQRPRQRSEMLARAAEAGSAARAGNPLQGGHLPVIGNDYESGKKGDLPPSKPHTLSIVAFDEVGRKSIDLKGSLSVSGAGSFSFPKDPARAAGITVVAVGVGSSISESTLSDGRKGSYPHTAPVKASDDCGNRTASGAPWTTYHDGRGNTWSRTIDPSNGNVLSVTAPTVTTGVLGGGTQTITSSFEYNTFGQLKAVTTPTGTRNELAYFTSGPATGYLASVTVDAPTSPGDSLSLQTSFARDAVGNVTAITDPKGGTETFVYNQVDQLVRHVAKAPFGYQTDLYYDRDDRLGSIDVQNVDEAGVVQPNATISTNYLYDALGRINKETADEGAGSPRSEYQYDSGGNLTLVKNPEAVNGHQPADVVRYLWDERGLLFRVTEAEGDTVASTTQWDYDGNGNVVARRQGLESGSPHFRADAYDGYDRPVSTADPMGNVTTVHYDANGNAVSVRTDGELIDGQSGTNVRLAEATMLHDEVDRPVERNEAFFDTATGNPIGDGQATTKVFYDLESRIIRVEDDAGNGTVTTYDRAGRTLTWTVDSTGDTIAFSSFTNDRNGNVLTQADTEYSDVTTNPPQTFVTTNTFDSLDRRTSTTDNAGHVTQLFWDSRDNLTLTIDPRENESRNVYDAVSRLTQIQRGMIDTGQGGGNLVYVLDQTRTYDDDSRVTSRTDDNGNTTTYEYDPKGRLQATAKADYYLSIQRYDVFDQKVLETDENGTTTTSAHDALDRVTSTTIARAPGILGTTFETWKYDGLSRVVSAQNDASLVTRAYDSLSHMTTETQQVGTAPVWTWTSVFDAVGNRHSAQSLSGNLVYVSTYDGAQRLQSMSVSGPNVCSGGAHSGVFCHGASDCLPGGSCAPLSPLVTTYDYMGPSRVVRRGNGNGTETTYAYDATGHVTGTTHARITPHVVIDDRTNTWDDAGNKTSRSDVRLPTGGTVHAYSYDSANRIVHSVETPPSGAAVTIDYAIDGLGNRTSVTGGSGAGTYTMSSTLPEPADFQVSQYTSTPFDAARTYDASGSLVGKTGATFQYDYRGQMVGSTCGTATSTYAYDAFGRRVREILAGGEERFLYDGRRVVEERDGSDVLKRAFVYGAGGNELLMTVGDVNGDGRLDRSFRHTDELGSVFAVTSQGGGVLERYDYEDGGKARFFTPAGASIPQSAIDNPILFQGLRYKFECDIALSQVGDCDPQIGRFTSAAGRNLWGDRFDKDPGNRTAYEPDWSTGFPFTGDTPPGKVDRREFVEYNGQQSNPFPFTVNRTVSGPGGILPTGPSSTGNIVEVCTGGPFTYYCCYYSETSGDWYGCIDIGWLETTTTE